jgi:hypothetical protein
VDTESPYGLGAHCWAPWELWGTFRNLVPCRPGATYTLTPLRPGGSIRKLEAVGAPRSNRGLSLKHRCTSTLSTHSHGPRRYIIGHTLHCTHCRGSRDEGLRRSRADADPPSRLAPHAHHTHAAPSTRPPMYTATPRPPWHTVTLTPHHTTRCHITTPLHSIHLATITHHYHTIPMSQHSTH